MKRNPWLFMSMLLVAGALLFSGAAQAQSSDKPTAGVNSGNYNIQQSLEFGYRWVDGSGNAAVYDTFVNLHNGPRLLEQTLSMHSLNHEGVLFDNLFVSSFGYGGDPDNATRLRMDKNKWYNFSLNFRRDQNFFDYNLLANPLNPVNSFITNPDSPHMLQTRRRWQDYSLTLMPQSPIRLRLGYSRNVNEGPSLTSFHEGTDVVLFQGWRTTVNAYQMGVDFKLLPRTNISYDQFLQYYKGDTSWVDRNQTFQLANGTAVDAGIIYNPVANSPCSNSPRPIFSPGTPPILRSTCNGYLNYSRFGGVRTSIPTEQLTVQSSYWRNLDLSGRLAYSGSEADVPAYNEVYNGLVTRTNQRAFTVTGNTRARRVVTTADFGATYRISERLRITDSFRFANFRIPGTFNSAEVSLFGTSVPGNLTRPPADPVACLTNPSRCPQYTGNSPADSVSELFARFLGQDAKYNTIEAEYDFSRKLGAHLGYRFGHRMDSFGGRELGTQIFFAGNGDCAPVPPATTCTVPMVPDFTEPFITDQVEINEHSALFGLWARPTDALRLNFDTELLSADQAPTRISPRQLQRYKLRGSYKLRNWGTFASTVNLLESRDNVTGVFHKQHNRTYGFGLTLNPQERLAFEMGYDYNDIFSTTNICYILSTTPPPNSTECPGAGPLITGTSVYTNQIHFGYTNIMWKPLKRITTQLGYNVVSTTGDTLILNPNQISLGPLAFNFHRPSASLAVDLAKGWSWNAAWGHYEYLEKSAPGVVAARNFDSDAATVSLRYAF